MKVSLETPSVFRRHTGNETRFDLEGSNIGEVIDSFVNKYPGTRKIFLDRDGNILHNYNVFINGENVYPLRREVPVKDGDNLALIMIINGG